MLYNSSRLYVFCLFFFFISVILSVLSGDIDIDPGLDLGYLNGFSFCHWNLNSISAHNFIKMSLMQPYNAIHRFDIICLSETYLGNSYHSDDDQLAFPGFITIHFICFILYSLYTIFFYWYNQGGQPN